MSVVIASACPGRADEFRFARFVQFKLTSVIGAGDVGSLTTTVKDQEIQMRLTNVAIAGADKSQELITLVDRTNLSLTKSVIYDVVKGEEIRTMQRKSGASLLDNKKTDVFEYTERKDGRVTQTEPYVEFKVADFLSVMLIAADAIHRKDPQPMDLSMLRDRSVTRVVLRVIGPEAVGGRPGTVVRVAPPDNPNGGVSYVIGRTNDGTYYPARISAETSSGLVQLDGTPQ